MLVDAVAGLQRGELTDAQRYLQFVQEHRGAAVAARAQAALRRYQRAESWADCRMWPVWGYKPEPPPRAPSKPKRKAQPRRRVT